MSLRTFAVLPPLVLALGLAACDSRDYEAEIATLQGDLESARAELEEAQGQNEQLTTQMEELQAQAEQPATGDSAALEPVQSEFNAIVEKASVSLANLTELEAQPDAPAELGDLRQNLQDIMQSVQTAASGLGLELAPAPAAGPEQGGAAPEAQPETGAQPQTGAQPEGEQPEQPAQQQQ
jgi:multidrug resistance efflux pump